MSSVAIRLIVDGYLTLKTAHLLKNFENIGSGCAVSWTARRGLSMLVARYRY
jgi:hypothetical protein